ncbi:serine hydrolase [Bosea sp. (in: a-proteobacteria)]|uniref:serine hydrolase n=1 Tax=Bosea sp. (in: a-proteobacteria) TaxID=1871050 RepID=UPI0039C8B15A
MTVAIEDLRDGSRIGIEAERQVPSASTRKIAFMMAAFRAVHEGRLSLDEPVVAEARFQEGIPSGTFYYMTPGLTFPLRDAIMQMIVTSDNICTAIVGERLPAEEITAFCRSVGMIGTEIRFTVPPREMPQDVSFDFVASTTAADQVTLLRLILDGSEGNAAALRKLGCSAELCRLALDMLSWQAYRTMIPLLLPNGARVCHKTGTGRNGKMDAGIVYRDGRPLFAIAAYAYDVAPTLPDGMPGYAAAMLAIGRLSRTCWDVLA